MRLTAISIWVLILSSAPPVAATHGADLHSSNVSLAANLGRSTFGYGGDLAFWDDTAIVGSVHEPAGFWVVDVSDPPHPKVRGLFACEGGQADVSIWEDLVFVSVDYLMVDSGCRAPQASGRRAIEGIGWQGIRIVSIADPARPVQIATVATDCGSHTHTLVPDIGHREANGEPRPRLLLYVSSFPQYPLTEVYESRGCGAVDHRKMSVVEVPLDDPTAARVVSTPDVSPSSGCHDVAVLADARRAAAACGSETQLWDLADPLRPTVVGRIRHPLIQYHHSAAFSWDGDVVVIGDESAVSGCEIKAGPPVGGLWFYDVRTFSEPQLRGTFTAPHHDRGMYCSAHNFNVVPLPDGEDVLVTGWFGAGTRIVDFTDPSAPTEIGYFVGREGAPSDAWSSYWHNGFIYVNNFRHTRGLDVLRIDDPRLESHLSMPYQNPQTQEWPAESLPVP